MSDATERLNAALEGRYAIVLLLTLVLASPSMIEAQVLQPSELCRDHPATAIVTFEDANLEAAIRGALSVGAQEDLTCGLVSGLTRLRAREAGIESLVGIQNLTSLTDLRLGGSSITDISALSGLTGLRELYLENNPDLTDIQPLLDNTGLGADDFVNLQGTSVSCTDEVAALRAKGVRVAGVFCWVNPLNEGAHERLSHGTFRSASMDVEVGYVIYLPPGYDDPANAERQYPVVYYLHGGGQFGSELRMANFMTVQYIDLIEASAVPPRIYVLVNGGRYSHYDYGESLGETAFVKELIPHIDENYRTIATRLGRAIEGFSAGGRGTARIVFKYPELFCSAAAMAGGHQHERMVSDGRATENNVGIPLPRDYNSWDRVSQYAAREGAPELDILVVVGTEDQNYESNLAWMDHLESLGIPFESRIVPDIDHDRGRIFSQIGDEIITFPESCFQRARVDSR